MAAPTFEIKLEDHASRRIDRLKASTERRIRWTQVSIVVSVVHIIMLVWFVLHGGAR